MTARGDAPSSTFNEIWLPPGQIVPVDIPTTGELLREIRRLRALQSETAPQDEGMVSVPMEPTDKMLQCFGHEWITGQARDCYRAMLAAGRKP